MLYTTVKVKLLHQLKYAMIHHHRKKVQGYQNQESADD